MCSFLQPPVIAFREIQHSYYSFGIEAMTDGEEIEVLTVLTINIITLWDVTSHNLVDRNHLFGATCYLASIK
jgi:hypothetical protein